MDWYVTCLVSTLCSVYGVCVVADHWRESLIPLPACRCTVQLYITVSQALLMCYGNMHSVNCKLSELVYTVWIGIYVTLWRVNLIWEENIKVTQATKITGSLGLRDVTLHIDEDCCSCCQSWVYLILSPLIKGRLVSICTWCTYALHIVIFKCKFNETWTSIVGILWIYSISEHDIFYTTN